MGRDHSLNNLCREFALTRRNPTTHKTKLREKTGIDSVLNIDGTQKGLLVCSVPRRNGKCSVFQKRVLPPVRFEIQILLLTGGIFWSMSSQEPKV